MRVCRREKLLFFVAIGLSFRSNPQLRRPLLENSVRFPHLLNTEILKGFDVDFKKDFLNTCTVRTYPEPTILYEQGEPAHSFVILAHGFIDVFYAGEDGLEVFVTRIKKGETLGEMETISGELCAASCKTSKNTIVLVCMHDQIMAALQEHQFIKNLTRIFYNRLLGDNKRKYLTQFGTVGDRLRGYLFVLSENTGRVSETQSYLANVVGCSRQTINRELALMREEGLIAQGGGEIVVLDRTALGRWLDQ